MATKEFPEHGIAYPNIDKARDRSLTRRDVFDLVWSMPLGKAAAMLGTTPRRIARFCHLAEVPAPGRGYWRTQRDMTLRPTLPEPSVFLPDFRVIVDLGSLGVCRRSEVLFPIALGATRSRVLASISQGMPAIAHGLSQHSVGDQHFRRTRLVDMLSEAIEELGGRVRRSADPFQPISINIGSQVVTIVVGVGAPFRKAGPRSAQTQIHEAYGLRIAELATPYAGRVHREWRDSNERSLEEQLSQILADLVVEADARCRRALASCLAGPKPKRTGNRT